MHIQKAPACSVISLAEALIEIFNSNQKLRLLELDMEKKCMRHL